MSLACQWGRCQDCTDDEECVCHCHIDDPYDDDTGEPFDE
jgi:hypothetical protein